MLSCVDYVSVRVVAGAHSVFTNLISNVPGILLTRSSFKNNLTENGRRWMLRHEQKSVSLMKDLV